MIYTVTLNPSVDFLTHLDKIYQGQTNYSRADQMVAGGRALNISRILRTMHVPTTATGFVGGRLGTFIEDELDHEGIQHDFIHTKNTTRINVSVFSNGTETRIVGHGADVSLEEVNDLMFYLSRLREGDFLVIAGSLPPNLNPEIYDRMVSIAVVNGAEFLPIVQSENLKGLIQKKPLLVAPDLHELSQICDLDEMNKETAALCATRLIDQGARNVIVNMEREGSLFVSEDKKVYESNGPQGHILSKTYTRMAMIAGFIGNYMRTNDPKEAFHAAQVTSNAAYYVPALPTLEQMKAEEKNVQVLPYA